MKGISSKISKGILKGSRLSCTDNSGALELEVVAVKGYKGSRRRLARAGVGDVVQCSVKKGKPALRKQVVPAVIVRQRKEWRRPEGIRVKFEENAAVLLDESLEPKGSEIKGAIAREAVERFPSLGKIASLVV